MSKEIYLVLTTDHIGGAEKRLLKIWIELKKRAALNLKLILLPQLLVHAKGQIELAEIDKYGDSIDTSLLTGKAATDLKVLSAYANSLSERALFHFVSLPPYLRSRKHKYLFSLPASGFREFS